MLEDQHVGLGSQSDLPQKRKRGIRKLSFPTTIPPSVLKELRDYIKLEVKKEVELLRAKLTVPDNPDKTQLSVSSVHKIVQESIQDFEEQQRRLQERLEISRLEDQVQRAEDSDETVSQAVLDKLEELKWGMRY